MIRIGEALARLQNGPELGVLGVQEMHVTGGHHGNSQLFTDAHNAPVEIPEGFLVLHPAFPQKEGIVADGLDFQIIVKPGDLAQFFFAGPIHHGAEQLAAFAGRTHNQPLAVFLDHGTGHVGLAPEIVQMAFGNEVVQVGHAVLGGRQQHNVPGIAQGAVLADAVEIVQFLCPGLFCFIQHPGQALGGGRRIVYGPVGILEGHTQPLAHAAQAVALEIGIQFPGQGQGIQPGRFVLNALPLQFAFQHSTVKLGIVGGNGTAVHKFEQLRYSLLRCRLVPEHLVGDVGDFHNLCRQRTAGVYQRSVAVHHLAVPQFHRTDFNDAVLLGIEAGGFKVQHNDGGIQAQLSCAFHHLVVVCQIPFHAGNQFDIVFLGSTKGFRECLRHTMVRHGNGRMAPFGSTFDQIGSGRNGIHVAHLGMQVQLNALFFGGIHTLCNGDLGHIPGHDHRLPGKFVVLGFPPHQYAHALFEGADHLLHLFPLFIGNGGRRRFVILGPAGAITQEHFAADGGGIVRHQESEQFHFAAGDGFGFHPQHFAGNHHQPAVIPDFPDIYRLFADGPAADTVIFFFWRLLGLFLGLHGGNFFIALRTLRRHTVLLGPLFPQLIQPSFFIAAHPQHHFRIQPEHVLNGLLQ